MLRFVALLLVCNHLTDVLFLKRKQFQLAAALPTSIGQPVAKDTAKPHPENSAWIANTHLGKGVHNGHQISKLEYVHKSGGILR